MSVENEPMFYPREMGETFQSYLQKYTDDEMMTIIRHPKTCARFCRMLYTLWEIEDTPVDSKYFKNMRSAYNYKVLEYHIRCWASRRKELLEKLSQYCKDLNRVSKCCIVGRIMLCLLETASTLYGLYKAENIYLDASALCGATGFFCSVGLFSAETLLTKYRLTYLTEFMKDEETFFRDIEEWLDQHTEIKEQVTNVFRLNFNRSLKEDIGEIIKRKTLKEYYSEGISILETNRHICDLSKFFLQYLHGDRRYYMYQRIAALDEKDRHLLSFPVLGRLFINSLSVVLDAYIWWRNDIPYVHYLRSLEEKLQDELNFMMLIISYDNSE